MKKLFSLFVAGVMLFNVLALSVAASETASGTCGENLTWELSDDGVLTIQGTGAMNDFASYSALPWYDYTWSIREVVIEDGVTTVGSYAFWFCDLIESLSLPDSLTTIGDKAFMYCEGLPSITVPAGVTSIGNEAFSYCENVSQITFLGDVPEIASNALTEIFALVYYPGDSESWTQFFAAADTAELNFGGNLFWKESGAENAAFLTDNGILIIPNTIPAADQGDMNCWDWDGSVLTLNGTENFPVKAIRVMPEVSSVTITLGSDTTLDSTDIGNRKLPVIQMMGKESTLTICTGAEYTLTVNSAGTSYGADAIQAGGSMVISDSVLNIKSNYGCLLVKEGDMYISDSEINAESGWCDCIETRGIRNYEEGGLVKWGDLTITNSTVSATKTESNAIYCDGNMVINESTVIADGGNNGLGNDCGNITITDSTVTATGNFIGICTYGRLNFDNSTITAIGDKEDPTNDYPEYSRAIEIGSRVESEEEIAKVEDFILNNCVIMTPENAEIITATFVWWSGDHETTVVVDDGDAATTDWVTEVKIEPGTNSGGGEEQIQISAPPVVPDQTYTADMGLSGIALGEGTVTDAAGNPISGVWSWANPNAVLYAGTTSVEVIFTPENTALAPISAQINVTVPTAEQALTSQHASPEAICIAYAGPGLEMKDMVTSNLDVQPVFVITKDEGEAYVEGTVLYSHEAGFVTVEACYPAVDLNGDGINEYNACSIEIHTKFTTVPMFRMYDPNSGEHFYTGSMEEVNILVAEGWKEEGVGFNYPALGAPVYRLYNPISGDHLYTMDQDEIACLENEGWNVEGVAFNSAADTEVAQYRLWNPNAERGAWHFTSNEDERNLLISYGWQDQGIGWYSTQK